MSPKKPTGNKLLSCLENEDSLEIEDRVSGNPVELSEIGEIVNCTYLSDDLFLIESKNLSIRDGGRNIIKEYTRDDLIKITRDYIAQNLTPQERILDEAYCKKLPPKEFYDLFVSAFKGNDEFRHSISQRIADIRIHYYRLLSKKESCENMTEKEFKDAVLAYPYEALMSKWACKRIPYKDASFPHGGLESIAKRYPGIALQFAHVTDVLSDDILEQLLEEYPEYKDTFSKNDEISRDFKC